ncbi:GTPase domain-containing protein [Halomicronema sp. CCY15110]|uniref:GTPase domain-containing protein n=1 Tax=Halomicronema sp. CCY15110 TaxID=2767773 RepID=UPI00194F774D|nr:GTPase domain-containing protein [Halomicronema sp. CCY15110]
MSQATKKLQKLKDNIFRPRKKIEQHIAVFGESGSGKTTLLNTFYGWHKEPAFKQNVGYSLLAEDANQGLRLSNGYLKMKESLLPETTRYQYHSFKFTITVKDLERPAGSIVWHDYPGEWWTENKKEVEARRKLEAFRSLLESDIAFFLCDGQSLKNEGGKYIRRLFGSFRDELERQKNAVLSDQKKLTTFPRIWVICLSKSDLFPDKDVYWFKDEVHRAAADEIIELKSVLGEILNGDQYQSIGEDFLLLSSAKFNPETGKIVDLKQNIGIDLIPPISIILPIKRALLWARVGEQGNAGIYKILEIFRNLTTNWMKYLPLVGNVFMLLDDTAKSATDKLKDIKISARKKGDSASAVVAAFAGKLRTDDTQKIYFSDKQ